MTITKSQVKVLHFFILSILTIVLSTFNLLTFDDVTEAAERMADIAMHINEHIRQNENFMKMLAIQRSFDSSAPKLLAPGRIFIKEGPLKKVCFLLLFSYVAFYLSLNLT